MPQEGRKGSRVGIWSSFSLKNSGYLWKKDIFWDLDIYGGEIHRQFYQNLSADKY